MRVWGCTYTSKNLGSKEIDTFGMPAEMNSTNIINKKGDMHLSDDAIIKTTKLSEIYGKLTKYENVTKNI